MSVGGQTLHPKSCISVLLFILNSLKNQVYKLISSQIIYASIGQNHHKLAKIRLIDTRLAFAYFYMDCGHC